MEHVRKHQQTIFLSLKDADIRYADVDGSVQTCTSVWQGNWFSVAIGPVPKAT